MKIETALKILSKHGKVKKKNGIYILEKPLILLKVYKSSIVRGEQTDKTDIDGFTISVEFFESSEMIAGFPETLNEAIFLFLHGNLITERQKA